ncbi:hypothetical protein KKC94_03785 [Patescibacteria group bacterium]|nr:hypothetical protein [Patescibacteria group bacterium]
MPGKNWNREVGTWRGERQSQPNVKHEKRAEFYKDRVKFKLQEEFQDVITNLTAKGYKTLEEHEKKDLAVKVQAGDTLYPILKEYYKNSFSLDDDKSEKEAYLSLAYIMHRTAPNRKGPVGNVDELDIGWEVEIKNGYLTILNPDGTKTMDNVPMRPPEVEIADDDDEKEPDETEKLGDEYEILDRHTYTDGEGNAIGKRIYVRVEGKTLDDPEITIEGKTYKLEKVGPSVSIYYRLFSKEELEEIGEKEKNEEQKQLEEEFKKSMEGFDGKYEIISTDKEILGIRVISSTASAVEVLKDPRGYWHLDGDSKLEYTSPLIAAMDAKAIEEGENIWNCYETKEEKPFYLDKETIYFSLSWQIDAYIKSPIRCDKVAFVEHLNAKFKNNFHPQEENPQKLEGEKNSAENKSRENIRMQLMNIKLDFKFEILNSKEILLSKENSPKKLKLRLDELSGEWEIEGNESLRYINLEDAVRDGEYILFVERATKSEKTGWKQNLINELIRGNWPYDSLPDVSTIVFDSDAYFLNPSFRRKHDSPVPITTIRDFLNERFKAIQQ